LNAVATAAAAVMTRIRSAQGTGAEIQLSPLANVAQVATPSARAIDPPPSSWPSSLREFRDAAIRFLVEHMATAAGVGRAPLCQFWYLFESWVAAATLETISDAIGRPPDRDDLAPTAGEAWGVRWDKVTPTLDVELWSQLQFTRQSNVFLDDPSFAVHSVTSDLRPDVLIAVRDRQEREIERVIWLVDAKFRLSGSITPQDAATAAAKYLWGLRREDTASFAVEKVLVATSGQPAVLNAAPERNRISVAHVGPRIPSDLSSKPGHLPTGWMIEPSD
jgi:hypothetical protein